MNPALLKILSYEPVKANTNAAGEFVYDPAVEILGKIQKQTVWLQNAPLEKKQVRNVLYTDYAVTKDSRVRTPGDAKGFVIKEDLGNGKYVLI